MFQKKSSKIFSSTHDPMQMTSDDPLSSVASSVSFPQNPIEFHHVDQPQFPASDGRVSDALMEKMELDCWWGICGDTYIPDYSPSRIEMVGEFFDFA